MSSGSASSSSCAQRHRERRAAPACRRSPGARTRRPRAGRRSTSPVASSRPPRANRSAISLHSRASRSASAANHAALASRRRSRPTRLHQAGTSRRAGSSSSQSRNASMPSPVRALTSIRGTPGCTASRWCRNSLEVEVEVRQQVDLVDQHQLAGAEHQRVLERLVLALGDRGDHDPRVLADVELGRADEVADVLDHQQVDALPAAAPAARSGPCSRRDGTRRRTRSVLSCVTGTCSEASRSAS